ERNSKQSIQFESLYFITDLCMVLQGLAGVHSSHVRMEGKSSEIAAVDRIPLRQGAATRTQTEEHRMAWGKHGDQPGIRYHDEPGAAVVHLSAPDPLRQQHERHLRILRHVGVIDC